MRKARRPGTVTLVLQVDSNGEQHRSATFGSTLFLISSMLLLKHQRLALGAGIAFACAILLAACGGGGASPRVLTTFQAASLALGQPDLTSSQPNLGGAPSANGLENPVGLALTPEGGLLVVDNGNNRVLLFSSLQQAGGAGASAVIGQPDFQSSAAAVTRTGLSGPISVAVGAGRMAVAERDSNRVVIYDRIPKAGEPIPVPSVVLGQQDFESSVAGCGAFGMDSPSGVEITPDGKLIVADVGNSRVLVWNQIPAPGVAAPAPNLVLGQSDLDHCQFADDNQDGLSERDPGTTLITSRITGRIMSPRSVWSDGTRLVVGDGDFNRALIWNSFPTTNFQPADVVLGQPDFTTRFANGATIRGEMPLPTARTFSDARYVHSDGTSLAVADLGNNRVLIWSAFPQANYQPADVVLGHADFEHAATSDLNQDGNADAPGPHVLGGPTAVLFTPSALFVSDGTFNRVLKFGQ